MGTPEHKIAGIEAVIAATRFDERALVPVIAQDAPTGVVRMFAWANAEALRATAASGRATFFSRSRAELWEKGATSGNTMPVEQIRIDCDGDVILYLVAADGPSCHEGPTSCFFRQSNGDGVLVSDDGPTATRSTILDRVAQVIASRRSAAADKSYVSSLLGKGTAKVSEKIVEEAGELVEALPSGDGKHIAHEAADLLFHVLVGLEAAEIPLTDVYAELERRFGTSGLLEKAERKK